MTKAKDKILDLARKRADEAASADLRNRDEAKIDLRFIVGEQWREEDRAQREAAGRPTLTINRCLQFVRQVTGQIRQLNPAIKVSPDDDSATPEVAEVYEGLIRSIQYRCDAPSVFEAAAESAAACGIGHFRVRADYAPGPVFHQQLSIERIENPFAVFWDPAAKHATRKDARYCFVIEEMPLDAFKAAYPDALAEDLTSDHKDVGAFTWATGKETVTVAEYFWVEDEEVQITLMSDGRVIEGAAPKAPPFNPLAIVQPAVPVKSRKMTRPRVKWAKITGADVLDGPKDIPGRHIPVIAVTGEEWHLGEDRYRSSVIRFARDPQRLYNFARSSFAEIVGYQSKAPWLLTQKQIAGVENFWQNAHNTPLPYLLYNPDEKAGAPQRVAPPISPQGVRDELMLASEDMKGTTGIYDASLGARSNEISGVAIAQRKSESQMSTSVYADNMVKAIRQCGVILLDMIPVIYDTRRTVPLMAEDGSEMLETINDQVETQDGLQPRNDLTVGSFAARVSVGPSYDTKRQEAREGMVGFLQAVPAAANVTADLVARAQDWPDADVFAERLKRILPPGVLDPKSLTPEEQQAAMQAQAQAQQTQQMAQQMAMAKAQADLRKVTADAAESEADAKKTEVEAANAQLDLMIRSGQLQAAVQQIVSQSLQAYLAPPPVPVQGLMQVPSGFSPQ